MFRYKALKPCRNEIICEIIWGGKIQTDVEEKGLPSQPKEIIYCKKLSSQWILQKIKTKQETWMSLCLGFTRKEFQFLFEDRAELLI